MDQEQSDIFTNEAKMQSKNWQAELQYLHDQYWHFLQQNIPQEDTTHNTNGIGIGYEPFGQHFNEEKHITKEAVKPFNMHRKDIDEGYKEYLYNPPRASDWLHANKKKYKTNDEEDDDEHDDGIDLSDHESFPEIYYTSPLSLRPIDVEANSFKWRVF